MERLSPFLHTHFSFPSRTTMTVNLLSKTGINKAKKFLDKKKDNKILFSCQEMEATEIILGENL
jgi:hypothetical protein